MFEHLAQGYALKKAPSTVIPVGISIKAAKEKYNLDTLYKLASNENPYGVSPKALEAMSSVPGFYPRYCFKKQTGTEAQLAS